MKSATLPSKDLAERALLAEGLEPSPLQLNWLYWRPDLRRRRPARRPQPWFWVAPSASERSDS